MGDADIGARPGTGCGEQRQPSLLAQKGCLAVIILGVFAAVVLPVIVWAAGILLAGSH